MRLRVLGGQQVAFEAKIVAEADVPADAVEMLEDGLLFRQIGRLRRRSRTIFSSEEFITRAIENRVLGYAGEINFARLVHVEGVRRCLGCLSRTPCGMNVVRVNVAVSFAAAPAAARRKSTSP